MGQKSRMNTTSTTSMVLVVTVAVPILIIALISLQTCVDANKFSTSPLSSSSSSTLLRFRRCNGFVPRETSTIKIRTTRNIANNNMRKYPLSLCGTSIRSSSSPAASGAAAAALTSSHSSSFVQSLSSIRGGGGKDTSMKSRKKKKKKVSSKKKRKKTKLHKRKSSVGAGAQVDEGGDGDNDYDDDDAIESSKSAIKNALKEDAATAMGDAIRARSSDFLQDDLTHIPIHHNDMTLNSISYAIGSSEQRQQDLLRNRHHRHQQQRLNANKPHQQRQRQSSKHPLHEDNRKYSSMGIYNDGGGVEPSSSAVIANYFLKSHGGLHGIQSIMSLLSVLFGIATFAIRITFPSATTAATAASTPNTTNRINLQTRLLQRTLLCALSKHLSGFIAAATASASRIPDIGWRGVNRNIKSFALDPVAQYLLYCAVLILWTNGVSLTAPTSSGAGAISDATTTAATTGSAAMIVPWWLKDKWNLYCISCLIGPILIREIVSTVWVIADVLILYNSSTTALQHHDLASGDQDNSDDNVGKSMNIRSNNTPSIQILSIGKSTIDAFMSILLTPEQWRNADPAQKQKQLAKLVARVSLLLEIGTGLILIIDAMRAFLDFSVSPVHSRPSWIGVAKRLICARLYINFMIVRRKKVVDLVSNLRGGFIVHRVLDLLDKPKDVMGLNWGVTKKTNEDGDDRGRTPQNYKEWITFLLDFR